jgi:RHS repeat-associated protein
MRLCQARDATDAVTREYLDEGEFVPGTPTEAYYYGIDQIGSVWRTFASTGSAPAYAYDPYGNPLQATAPLTDFGYAGMLRDADSGLNLTLFRAYDPVAGRWLSRDPIGDARIGEQSVDRWLAQRSITSAGPSFGMPRAILASQLRRQAPPKVVPKGNENAGQGLPNLSVRSRGGSNAHMQPGR